jgi:YjbE family integral membrane protein
MAPVLQIIWIDIVLSGDNAVVIGLACRALPERQRMLGTALGTGAAVLLRVLLTIVVVEVLHLSYVRLVGGILLFWIAIRLALQESDETSVKPAGSIFAAVRIIVVADTIMSLDNVMAIAAAAKGSILLVAFGLALSVPFIIFGATLFLAVFSRYPALIWAGAALLGYIGGELISSDPLFAAIPLAQLPHWEPLCGTFGVTLVLAIAAVLQLFTRTPKPIEPG